MSTLEQGPNEREHTFVPDNVIDKAMSLLEGRNWHHEWVSSRTLRKVFIEKPEYPNDYVQVFEIKRKSKHQSEDDWTYGHRLSVWEYAGSDPGIRDPALVTHWDIDLVTKELRIMQSGYLLSEASKIYGEADIRDCVEIPDAFASLAVHTASDPEIVARLDSLIDQVTVAKQTQAE